MYIRKQNLIKHKNSGKLDINTITNSLCESVCTLSVTDTTPFVFETKCCVRQLVSHRDKGCVQDIKKFTEQSRRHLSFHAI